MANRCLADRTNAWTDTDHTCYTVYTAGKEGFLTILPVYVDHILFPLLREDAFVTEVHHINGQGKDSGVVYSEMQVCQTHMLSPCYMPFRLLGNYFYFSYLFTTLWSSFFIEGKRKSSKYNSFIGNDETCLPRKFEL